MNSMNFTATTTGPQYYADLVFFRLHSCQMSHSKSRALHDDRQPYRRFPERMTSSESVAHFHRDNDPLPQLL